MALIIEDGSIVADANTYIDEAEAAAILDAKFGITATITEQELKAAAQYLEGFCDQFQGHKVDPASQSLCWPRQGVYIDCILQPSDSIPSQLKTAQALAAYEENQGNSLQPNVSNQATTSKSIAGQISVTKSDNGMNDGYSFTKVNQYLLPLLADLNAKMKVFRV
jgi:hypothetical protein